MTITNAEPKSHFDRRPKTKPVPKFPGLAINIHCPLSKANAKLATDFHKAACQFDKRLAELHDRHKALCEQAGDLTLSKIRGIGNEIIKEHRQLREDLIALRWRRFGILPRLVADFAEAAKAAEVAHELGYELAAKRFASEGITAASMPAGATNSRAAGVQFRKRLETEPEVLKTIVPMRNADQALRGIEAASLNPPRAKACVVPWPQPSGDYGFDAVRVADLDRPRPSTSSDDPCLGSVICELGFNDSPLPSEWQAILVEIARACNTGGIVHPVRGTCQRLRNPSKLFELVSQLPRTREIDSLFHVLKAAGVKV